MLFSCAKWHPTYGYSATSFLLNVGTIFSIKNTTFCPLGTIKAIGWDGFRFLIPHFHPIPFLVWEKLAPGKNGTSWVWVKFKGILLTIKIMFYNFSRKQYILFDLYI